ncbi:hypothetical protein C0991_007508 [Blastosporella zonata]|nr:hypothetical protein C0991_007508 [Blastosporella zonata]
MTTATTSNTKINMSGVRVAEGSQQIVWRPKGRGGEAKTSLIISPNLDALLEYEEKVRLTSPTSPQFAPGLPPPPRRNSRKAGPRSPTSPKVGSPLIQEAWGWAENPYINPAPELEELLAREMAGDVAGESGTHGPSADGEVCSVGAPRPSSGKSRLLRPFAIFNDASSKVELKTGDVSNTQKRTRKGQRMDDLVLDIRRDVSNELGRRPMLSHARPSSSSSSSSSSSYSTVSPTSTIDPRISISSTMYPTSTVYSHGVYVDEPLPIIPPHRSSSLYSRQSFIDILSPTAPEFTMSPQFTNSPQSNAPEYSRQSEFSRHSTPSPSPVDHKPPLPATPKPTFNRSVPPTTNFLDLEERSDLIRKNRKLAKVFGQNPGPDAIPHQFSRNTKPPVLPMISAVHQRSSLSLEHHGVWLPQTDLIHTAHTRRHSDPLSPDYHQSFLGDITTSRPYIPAQDENRASSPTSFIDLSDDLPSASLPAPKHRASAAAYTSRGRPRRPSSPSAQSLFESMTPEEQAEESRKRKREKLAKLHRFLGSRVPTNLVLGPDLPDPPLPPLDPTIMATMNENEVTRKDWLRRRRSSSAAAYRSTWSDEIDRVKEDLNSAEKAINVRRAQKMEKVFGVAPPQTLYHTRRSPSPSVTKAAAITGNKIVSGWTSPGESLPPVTGLRNPNRSSYAKPKKTKDGRPGTSESNKALLPKKRDDSREPGLRRRSSVVYTHYQESLNSLTDIIDRDDKESLAELHEYLNSGDMTVAPPLQAFVRTPTTPTASDRRLSNASSIKSERRRSLPARTSIISDTSDYSVTTPRPEVTDFQARRRRAAKLTQFFGVNYKELITEVLESIETGLEHERKRGTLGPEEAEAFAFAYPDSRIPNYPTQA